MGPGRLFAIVWLLWAVSWIVAAVWRSPAARNIPLKDAVSYRLPIVVGIILLYYRVSILLQAPRLWHVGYDGAYALVGVTVLGFAFAWWARIYLGSLWSGNVTIKEGHRVVDTGPYALVRHPIYTGLCLSTIASAAALATLPGVVGAALIIFGFWLKARIEERFLAEALGEAAYADYRRRVPMLVPFMPAG